MNGELRFVLIPKKEIGEEKFYGEAEHSVGRFYEERRDYDTVLRSRDCRFDPWSRNPEEVENNARLKEALKDRRGLPDLLALRDGSDPRFVEVKGAEDTYALTKSQADWILRHISDFSVDVVLTRRTISEVRETSFIPASSEGVKRA